MNDTEIWPLTEDTVARLLPGRGTPDVKDDYEGNGRRKTPRFPFSGKVELWVGRSC